MLSSLLATAVFSPAHFPAPTPRESIQQALDAAADTNGGIVQLEGIHYRLDGPLVMDDGGVTLSGVGWGGGNSYKGTLLHNVNPSSPIILIEGAQGDSVVIKDLAIYQDQPPYVEGQDWAPHDSPYAIQITKVDDVYLNNLLLYNVTRGISGIAAGRLQVERLYGQPLVAGLYLDQVYDVPRFDGIHFWPFWSYAPHVKDWVEANGTAMQLDRVDNPQFSNIFTFGYRNGLVFGQSASGVTSRFKLSNVEFDQAGVGVMLLGNGITGQASNYSSHGFDMPSSLGIHVFGEDNHLQLSNARLSYQEANAIRVNGKNSTVDVVNPFIEEWDRSRKGFPALEALNGGKIRALFPTLSGGGRVTRGDVRISE